MDPTGLHGTRSTARTSEPLAGLIAPEEIRWRGDVAGTGVGTRFAILVAADTYQASSWNIPFAANNVDRLAGALSESCGIPGSQVRRFAGGDVNLQSIENGILEFGRRARGEGNLLLFYYTGHGTIDDQGTPCLFTHYTREAGAGGYEGVIRSSDLSAWIAEAKGAARGNGARIAAMVIIDACRTRAMGPPRGAILRPAEEWVVYGTKEGRFAEAPGPGAPSPFTGALSESIDALAGSGEAGLTRVFEETRRRTLERTGGVQEPQMIRQTNSLEEPALVVPNRVHVALRVVDALSDVQVPEASIALGARQASGGDAAFDLPPGRQLLRVQAPGYLTRSEEILVERAHNGKLLEIPLHPGFVVVSGSVSPPRVVELRVRGGSLQTREGLHRLETTSSSDGAFRLLVPGLEAGMELVTVESGSITLYVPLPVVPDRFTRESSGRYDGIGVVDVGVLSLQTARTAGSPGAGHLARVRASRAPSTGGMSLPLPDIYSTPPDPDVRFATTIDRNDYEQAIRMIEGERFDIALRLLRGLGERHPPESEPGRAVHRAIGWVALQRVQQTGGSGPPIGDILAGNDLLSAALHVVDLDRALQSAAASARQDPAGATAALADAKQMETYSTTGEALSYWYEVKAAAARQRIGIGADLLDGLIGNRDWSGVLAAVDALKWGGDPEWMDLLSDVVPIALEPLLSQTLAHGLQDGDWSGVDDLLARVDNGWGHAVPGIAQTALRVRQERIPLETRRAYESAQMAFARGDLEGAFDQYTAAREQANDHYKRLIDSQLAYLRETLYIRHANEGLEHEAEGRIGEAALAYIQAERFDNRAAVALRQLCQTPEGMRLPVLQRWRETEAARAREADAARRAREAVDTAERAARENITNPLGMRFRLIPAGEFLMGSPASEAGRDDDETQHRVRITRPFYMGVTEVTQAQWEAVMRSDPSGFKGADLSVDRVSWDDCQEFIRRLNAREAGVTYRLPTEAEWEYACRAGTTTRYGFGDDEARLGEYAWYFANGGRTYPVGQKRANGWGLFDMHGNVWEWCQDWYAETYGSGEQVDPAGPGSEDGRRVLRGGSWSNNVGDLRSARRYGSAPSNRLYGCGFRLARSS